MLTLFSWGYWGWGNTASRLIQAVDTTERDRGFQPPMFFDIRAHRAVRASDFRGDIFERLLPAKRYEWFSALGNRRVINHEGGIEIKDPSAARTLLEQAMQYARDNRRVIFFCACPFPQDCHRRAVAKLILKEANGIGRRVVTVEWPGGEAVRKTMPVEDSVFKAVTRGLKNVPLGNRKVACDLVCLPWGSILDVTNGGEKLPIITGPAKFRHGWMLPVYHLSEAGTSGEQLRRLSGQFRRRNGLEPMDSLPSRDRSHGKPKL